MNWWFVRAGLGLIALFCALAALRPTTDRWHREGNRLLMGLSLLSLTLAVFWPLFLRALARPGGVLLLVFPAGLLACLLWPAFALLYARRRRSSGNERFLLILGCPPERGKISPLLRGRLTAAQRCLSEREDVRAILCGGSFSGEEPDEASLMRQELRARGIAPARLFVENQSRSTFENFLRAAPILRKLGYDGAEPLAVATDAFHFWRAAHLAKRAGFRSVRLVPSDTPIGGAWDWCYRELLGAGKYLLCGAEGMRAPEKREKSKK